MILDKSNLNDCKILNTQASETYISSQDCQIYQESQDSQDDQDFQGRISQDIQRVYISLKRIIPIFTKWLKL